MKKENSQENSRAKNHIPMWKRFGTTIGAIALSFISLIFVLYVWSEIYVEENFARWTQTNAHNEKEASKNEDLIVRFVIHKLLPEENAVEGSLILIINTHTQLADDMRKTGLTLFAQVDDWSSSVMHAMSSKTESLSAQDFMPSHLYAVTRSQRFTIPTMSSFGAFPFDETRLRPHFVVRTNIGYTVKAKIEIQKAFPGRILKSHWDQGGIQISMPRSNVEVAFVLGTSSVFLLASASVAAAALLSKKAAAELPQLIALAAYLVAAASYRDLLGVSKLPAVSILELFVLGIPR